MMTRIVRHSLLLLLLASCEDCPDRSVPIDVTGNVTRGAASTIVVAFPEPVFVEPSPQREADILLELAGPAGDDSVSASWRGDEGATNEPFVRVVVLDDARLEIELLVDQTAVAGEYELTVIADRAGACLGPNGVATLDVR